MRLFKPFLLLLVLTFAVWAYQAPCHFGVVIEALKPPQIEAFVGVEQDGPVLLDVQPVRLITNFISEYQKGAGSVVAPLLA